MGQFDALVDDLDRFQRWKGRKARKPSIAPQPRPSPASAPGRPAPAQSSSKAMQAVAADTADMRRRAAQLRAQNAEGERQRRFAALDGIMSKAMTAVAEGTMTAVEAITIDRRCAAIAARLHAEDRAAKAGKPGR